MFNSCASVCTHTTVNQHIEHNRYTCYGHYLNVTEAHQPLTFTTTHFLPVYFLPLHFLPLQLHIPMSYLFSLQLWGAWRFPIMSYPFYKHVMYGKCRFEENLIEVCAGVRRQNTHHYTQIHRQDWLPLPAQCFFTSFCFLLQKLSLLLFYNVSPSNTNS